MESGRERLWKKAKAVGFAGLTSEELRFAMRFIEESAFLSRAFEYVSKRPRPRLRLRLRLVPKC